MTSRTRRLVDDSGAELVAHFAATADEGFLLGDALPLAGEQVEPEIVRVPVEGRARQRQLAESVVEDRTAGDLGEQLGGRGQPVRRCDAPARVEAQLGGEPGAQVRDFDPVVDRPVGPLHDPNARFTGRGEVRRVAAECLGQALGEHFRDRRAMTGDVLRVQEQLQTRAPLVVGGAGGVESEDFRAAAQASGGVRNSGNGLVQQGPYGFEVEVAGEFQSGDEGQRGHAVERAGSACGRRRLFLSTSSGCGG